MFLSKRERRLWILAAFVVATIYSTLGLARTLADVFRNRGAVDEIFVAGFVLLWIAIGALALGKRPTLLQIGVLIGLASIYIILAWTFASYVRPVVVMAIIPMGLVGAVLGHLLLGYNFSMLSLTALIGLSGIVVNNSIILVNTMERRAESEPLADAIVNGTCDRLRPVILTSATTIGGLTPLLFEKSLQAQFLIPMAVTIVFGLGCAAVLVLSVIPALMAVQEDLRKLLGQPAEMTASGSGT